MLVIKSGQTRHDCRLLRNDNLRMRLRVVLLTRGTTWTECKEPIGRSAILLSPGSRPRTSKLKSSLQRTQKTSVHMDVSLRRSPHLRWTQELGCEYRGAANT